MAKLVKPGGSNGLARRAAARTAAVALVGEVSAVRLPASFSATNLRFFRKELGDALAEESHVLQLCLQSGIQHLSSVDGDRMYFTGE